MKTNRGIPARTVAALVFLALVLVGFSYYLLFLKPLREELSDIEAQSLALDSEIAIASAKVGKMNTMQAELDELMALPAEELTEIAPYDNAKVVMTQLNGILRNSDEYDLNFRDPVIESDGTVRRVVAMKFNCRDYNGAKAIIDALQASHWRCLINSISLEADENQIELTEARERAARETSEENAGAVISVISEEEEPQAMSIIGSVTVAATITFFESMNIE
ncbi:MAG: hypothetical protein MJ067_02360 [Oscillospiraceae bacterium]|nr:hypothetical protein [Oscillospiraceae bacterium]